jgi:hypothetical protein
MSSICPRCTLSFQTAYGKNKDGVLHCCGHCSDDRGHGKRCTTQGVVRGPPQTSQQNVTSTAARTCRGCGLRFQGRGKWRTFCCGHCSGNRGHGIRCTTQGVVRGPPQTSQQDVPDYQARRQRRGPPERSVPYQHQFETQATPSPSDYHSGSPRPAPAEAADSSRPAPAEAADSTTPAPTEAADLYTCMCMVCRNAAIQCALPCGHCLCLECLNRLCSLPQLWLCPMCRCCFTSFHRIYV